MAGLALLVRRRDSSPTVEARDVIVLAAATNKLARLETQEKVTEPLRWVEGPVARRLMGVEVHGISPLGIEEWYQARAWRRIHVGCVSIAGENRGGLGPAGTPLHVGFSEPPARPGITDVAVRIRRLRPGPRHGAEHRRA